MGSAEGATWARKAAPGDILIIATYAIMNENEVDSFSTNLVYVDAKNCIMGRRSSIPAQMS
jgi:aspartate 1-decarboxylase